MTLIWSVIFSTWSQARLLLSSTIPAKGFLCYYNTSLNLMMIMMMMMLVAMMMTMMSSDLTTHQPIRVVASKWYINLVSYRNVYKDKKKKKKKRWRKGSATITSRSPSQTQRRRGNRQSQTSANRTNVRKALRLALSLFPKRGNRNAQRTEKHKSKITQGKT